MMTRSITRSVSFTITDAREVGAKVGTDLRLLHNLYGRPTLGKIDDFAEEVALLLREGYLDTVDYGFRDTGDNSWKLRLRYRATAGGQLLDSRPGSYPRDLPLENYAFCSFLTYSMKFLLLDGTDRERFTATLPVQRETAEEPTAYSGTTTSGHGYSRNGVGILRDVYVAAF
jgi:hypothetical protein